MLRIVKMEFKLGQEDAFLTHFHASASKIKAFPGCKSLRLLRDQKNTNIFFTYSRWERPEDLEIYRRSDLFSSTWAKVKPLFLRRAEAWSVDSIWHDEE